MRDDFSTNIKRALADRVGNRCSRPECGAATSGPQDDPVRAVNVGVAAHITAAATSGPRYDVSLSQKARKSAENGIWLCQNCAKLVDNDPDRFSANILQGWKHRREGEAKSAVGLAERKTSLRGRAPHGERPLLVEFAVGKLVERGVGETPKFVFKVANPHARPATIVGAGIEAPSIGLSVPVLRFEMSQPPQQITDGQSMAFLSDVDLFEAQLRGRGVIGQVEVVGYVTDALGQRHQSTPVIFPD